MKKLSLLSLSAAFGLMTQLADAQQLKVPAPSPLQTMEQHFALSTIKIEYSRPSVKGRTIFGEVVPFGEIWRTGANSATKITFGEDVKIEGSALAAGSYALYTIPNKDSWDVMFYKDLNLGGNTAEYKTENEALRIKVKPSSLTGKVETFTINLGDITPNTATLELTWDRTRVALGVTAEIESKIMKNIEASVEKDNRPYFQAASYYYENNKDLNKALGWVNKAIESNPNAFWMTHLKAKIQVKMKDYKGAVSSAQESITKAKEAKNNDYVRMNEKLIAEAEKSK